MYNELKLYLHHSLISCSFMLFVHEMNVYFSLFHLVFREAELLMMMMVMGDGDEDDNSYFAYE